MLHPKPFFFFIAMLVACTPRPTEQNSAALDDSLNMHRRSITDVLAAHTDAWMRIEGVTGTGETQKAGKPAVMILVDSLTDSLRNKLPATVEGYPVVIETTGSIKAYKR
ncbi:MAG: hypothetical protein Q8922_05575 [Bacteroidota bacterium]|nr:hypothetical protein [Bacteroidota bacterium]MDP4233127.1 hypothetical protein [Bacteroidota bacterium]MDP4241728.1 hypothetical protein [Bacteroidota bacterium]MDP4287386.1 hypothetical protein [Bacteroidota bacterium]